MYESLDILGDEYYYANYNPSGGYKCCKTVIYHLFLNTDNFHETLTPNIPQLDMCEQLLILHLYNGETPFNIVNAETIKITFDCDGETVEGDPQRLDTYNPYRGTITYIMSNMETKNVGLNTMTITVGMGSQTVDFKACYNVVANVTIGNEDGTTYQGMTLQDLIDTLMNHINNTDIHCDEYKNMNISRAFITLDTVDDLDLLDKGKLVNGKMFRVNTDPVSYYYYDSNDKDFKTLVL